MNSRDFFWNLGEGLANFLGFIYDEDQGFTAFFNYFLVFAGICGMIYWLTRQKKYNNEAANDSKQLK